LWKFGRTWKTCENTCLSAYVPTTFVVLPNLLSYTYRTPALYMLSISLTFLDNVLLVHLPTNQDCSILLSLVCAHVLCCVLMCLDKKKTWYWHSFGSLIIVGLWKGQVLKINIQRSHELFQHWDLKTVDVFNSWLSGRIALWLIWIWVWEKLNKPDQSLGIWDFIHLALGTVSKHLVLLYVHVYVV